MATQCFYPKGDLRRMLAVLGAIDQLPEPTLRKISEAVGFGRHNGHTVRRLIDQAEQQAWVKFNRIGFAYSIASWGPALQREGAIKALREAQTRVQPEAQTV
jgi:DNA-binding IclR family transcriptional regulator